MALKNYTTTVPAHKTIAQVQQRLAEHGASKVLTEYGGGGEPCGMTFFADTPSGTRAFSLPARIDAVQAVLEEQGVKHDRETARKVAWRNVKDWLEAQIAMVETGQAEIDEVFLPYMVDSTGTTLYEAHRKGLLEGGFE